MTPPSSIIYLTHSYTFQNKYLSSLAFTKKTFLLEYQHMMEISEMRHSETTEIAILNTESAEYQDNTIASTTIVPIKESYKWLSWESFLYLTIIYFLSMGLFYLCLCLFRNKYITCSLECSDTDLTCSCQLQNRISEFNSTFVELAWQQSLMQTKNIDPSQISNIKIYNNLTRSTIILQSQLEEVCLPSECQLLLGTFPNPIDNNSTFTIAFNNLNPFQNNQQLRAVFWSTDPSYPQLSAQAQLAINVVFAIITGVFAFLRKKIKEVYPNLEFPLQDDKEKQEEQPVVITVPEQIQDANKSLQIHIKRASKHMQHILSKAKHHSLISRTESHESDQQLQF